MVHRELVVPNDTQYLATVREEVTKVVEQSAFAPRDRKLLILAVDEAVTNIMEHAYDTDLEGELDVELILEADATRFEVVIRDSGKEFDPSTVDIPDISAHVSKGQKHGLGIFLIRQIMDEINYTYVHGEKNQLQMIKYVDRNKRKDPAAGGGGKE
jgi:anti-sigma regulatory factor (Ser/Thr protein kinase)